MTDAGDADLPPTRQLSWIPLLGAFAIVVLVVVLTLVFNNGENRGAPNAPRVDAKNALLCPGTFRFDPRTTWVPNDPIGVSVADGLVPDESPEKVVVCRYAAPTAAATAQAVAFQGRAVLTGDLDKARSTLVSAKVKQGTHGTGKIGPAVYLIGITYPEGTLWVSVGTGADGNGKVVTTEDLEPFASSAYTAKRWP